jgi:hypothetical protein
MKKRKVYAVDNFSEGLVNKRTVIIALGLLVLGTAPLVNSLNNPRLAGMHGADRLQLFAVGWCYGMAFAFLLAGRMAKGK